jgi:dTDP-4-dehydrorhamnose reductase
VKVFVCGAGGMLGQDVVRAATLANHEVVAFERLELDITDAAAVSALVDRENPQAVVNCAAYTNVDGAEDEPGEALRVNAEGARNVAAAAAEIGASVVYPSTDYVFDGTKPEPYVESDEPSPLSSYGRTKLAGELATREANPSHHVVRSSWLFGEGGRNFVETMLELGREQGQVVVVRDQVGSPTWTLHLGEGLVRMLDSRAFGVHHMAAAGECSWYDFAREIFARASVDCHVLSCTTEELGRPAPRPAYSVLRSERAEAITLPDWRVGLEGYLAERAATDPLQEPEHA